MRAMYTRFETLVRARGLGLKAITAPEGTGSRAFHEALGFSVEEVEVLAERGRAAGVQAPARSRLTDALAARVSRR